MKSTEVYDQYFVSVTELHSDTISTISTLLFTLYWKTSSQQYTGWGCSTALGYLFKSGG